MTPLPSLTSCCSLYTMHRTRLSTSSPVFVDLAKYGWPPAGPGAMGPRSALFHTHNASESNEGDAHDAATSGEAIHSTRSARPNAAFALLMPSVSTTSLVVARSPAVSCSMTGSP